MSGDPLAPVIVPENMVRDFFMSATLNANQAYDIANTFGSLGLDFFIRNRGAAAVTVSINGNPAITIDPGDVFRFNHTKFWLIDITTAVTIDIAIFGVTVQTLRRRGLMPKPGEMF